MTDYKPGTSKSGFWKQKSLHCRHIYVTDKRDKIPKASAKDYNAAKAGVDLHSCQLAEANGNEGSTHGLFYKE